MQNSLQRFIVRIMAAIRISSNSVYLSVANMLKLTIASPERRTPRNEIMNRVHGYEEQDAFLLWELNKSVAWYSIHFWHNFISILQLEGEHYWTCLHL